MIAARTFWASLTNRVKSSCSAWMREEPNRALIREVVAVSFCAWLPRMMSDCPVISYRSCFTRFRCWTS